MRWVLLAAAVTLLGCEPAAALDAGPIDPGVDAGPIDAGDGDDAGPPGCFGPPEVLDGVGGVDLAVSAGRAFVATGVEVRAVRLGGALESEGVVAVAARQLAVEGDRLFAHDGASIHLVDAAAASPTAVAAIDVAGEATAAASGDRLLVFRHPLAARINTFEVHSIASLATPQVLGETSLRGQTPARMAVAGDRAFVLDRGAGDGILRVLDVANPGAVTELGTLALGPAPEAARVVSGAAVYVGLADAVRAVDVSDPAAPATLEELPGGPALALGAGQLAVGGPDGVRVYDEGAAGLVLRASLDSGPVEALAWTGDAWLVLRSGALFRHPWRCP